MTKVLFLDESGDHNLSDIDLNYPLFVLGGVIMDLEYAQEVLEPQLTAFKRELFGRTDIILHTADITRNRNGFEKLKDRNFRNLFYERLNALMRSLQYQVIACVIRKDEHLSRYGLKALDPYMLSLDIVVERFCFEIGNRYHGGIIVAESRGDLLDRQLELAWVNLKMLGTRYLQAKDIRHRIGSLACQRKCDNIAGLQLADLVCTPIGRRVLGKPRKPDWEIVESKLRCNWRGEYDGYGLVVLPKR